MLVAISASMLEAPRQIFLSPLAELRASAISLCTLIQSPSLLPAWTPSLHSAIQPGNTSEQSSSGLTQAGYFSGASLVGVLPVPVPELSSWDLYPCLCCFPQPQLCTASQELHCSQTAGSCVLTTTTLPTIPAAVHLSAGQKLGPNRSHGSRD